MHLRIVKRSWRQGGHLITRSSRIGRDGNGRALGILIIEHDLSERQRHAAHQGVPACRFVEGAVVAQRQILVPQRLDECWNGLALRCLSRPADRGIAGAYAAKLLLVAQKHHLHGQGHRKWVDSIRFAVGQHGFHTVVVGNNDEAAVHIVGKGVEVLHAEFLVGQFPLERGRLSFALRVTRWGLGQKFVGNLASLLPVYGMSLQHHGDDCEKQQRGNESFHKQDIK